MPSALDLSPSFGAIGAYALNAIRFSTLYRALVANWGEVEVWPARSQPPGDWSYFWLVSLRGGPVRELAFVRHRWHNGDVLEERIQGPFGQELWVGAEIERPRP